MSKVIKNEGHLLKAITQDGHFLNVVGVPMECYVLDNEKHTRVVAGRGFIRALLGIEDTSNLSGQRMQRLSKNEEILKLLNDETRCKLENPIHFLNKAGQERIGYDATALPLVAKSLWEAYLKGDIKQGHTYFNEAKNAGHLIESFLWVSIIAFVGKFLKKDVRKTFYNGEWWFVLNDIMVALTETKDPSDYMKKVKNRDNELSKGWGQIITPLKIDTAGGKQK